MKITNKTKWAEFAPFATPQRVAQLREKITDCAIFDFMALKIGDFSPMLSGGMPEEIKSKIENPNITVFEVIRWLNAIDEFLKKFSSIMESMEIEVESDEKQALAFMPQLSPLENILNFCLDNFGQHPVKGGFNEDITLVEFIMRKRHVHAQNVYQRALNKIQTAKMKLK